MAKRTIAANMWMTKERRMYLLSQINKRNVQNKQKIRKVGTSIEAREDQGNADHASVNQFIRYEEYPDRHCGKKCPYGHPQIADQVGL